MKEVQVGAPETIRTRDGLRSQDVDERLRRYGYNEIPEKKTRPLARLLKKFWGVTPWMLEITILLEWALGKFLEMSVVAGLLFFNAVVGFFQEERANAALALLKNKLKTNARVKRDGKWTVLPARELVPGDVVRLRAGDFVPADVEIVEGSAMVDQSSLTGESRMLDRKEAEILYGGSMIGRGEVTGIVAATGIGTYFGRTVELVRIARPKLHMEEVTSRVARWLIGIIGFLLLVAMVFSALHGRNLMEILPLAVVLMVSAVPVALPTMFTISMALGSLELMRKGILITRLSAIEDAATMTIVCADKTGTLTANRLAVVEALPVAPYSERDVKLCAALASREADQDPIDLAVLSAARDAGIPLTDHVRKDFVPFDPSTRRTEAILEKGGRQSIVVKGAVNAIWPLCKKSGARAELEREVESRAAEGYRVIACARGTARDDLEPVGVIFLSDQPRPDSRRLLTELGDLGLEVKMLTGDSLPLAKAVAKELGLGGRIAKISDLKSGQEARISRLAEESDGFAEIYPEDKYLIVQSLQKAGHVVGMTGDGVNDAPALRQAEVGIAVGSATDVAKKAASAVLLTEGLEGIVDLVKIGRAAYQRILTYILNKIIKTFQITVFVVLVFLATGEYVISALHMILLLFLTDFVSLAISTDRVPISGKPDRWDITGLVKVAVWIGMLVIAELALLLYAGSSYFGIFRDLNRLQTLTFETLICIELLNVMIIRERRHFWRSRPGTGLLAAVTADLGLVLLISVAGFPGITPVPLSSALGVLVFSAIAAFLINDPVKVFLIEKFWHEKSVA